MNDQDKKWWSEIDEFENKAHGLLAGGMVVDAGNSTQTEISQTVDHQEIASLLESVGAKRATPGNAETVAEMKQEIIHLFEASAQMAAIAARNFESLPDEAVKNVYEELMQLKMRRGA